jgi:CRP/FNR family transcriptional regulator, cyclic AMP receptor protein
MSPSNHDLRSIALFRSLPPAALNRLVETAIPRAYEPDETIFLAEEPCRAVYFIVRGQVRVYRLSPEGQKQVLAILGPGQAFNTVPPFLEDAVTHASAEALTRVTIYALPKEDYLRLMRRCPDLAMGVLREFAQRLDHLTGLVEDLALHSVTGRLARFLLQQAEGEAVARRWTQAEMAEQLGTVRDVVGRSLRGFEDRGLIRMERGRIVLLNRPGLEEEAQH